MKRKSGKRFLGGFIFLAVFAAAIAVVMLLWNALIPSIIGWSAINYWQAAGLVILCKLLFGGMGHWGHRGFKPFSHNRKQHAAFHEAMRNMTRDERRDFIRKRMAEGYGGFEFRERPQGHPGE